jgi:hypothetical protein
MAETMIVPIVTALAPYVLDTFFGEGYRPQHIPEHVWNDIRNISRFSLPSIKDKMSLYGYGYRYPRAKRKTIEIMYPKEYAKAAIFNKAVAANNNWVQFLKFNGYYDEIRKLLQRASQEYKQSGLAKQYSTDDLVKMKEAKLRKLRAQAQALSNYARELQAEYPTKYNEGLTFQEALNELAYKLDNEFEALGQGRPFRTAKEQPPSRRKPKWFKVQPIESERSSTPSRVFEV